MAKRRLNVLAAINEKSEQDEESCYNVSDSEYDSENDRSYQPVSKRRCNYRNNVMSGCMNKIRKLSDREILPKEDNEHTYSCTPTFTNNGNSSDYSCDSDYINDKYNSERISEKSTSSESIKSGRPRPKGKSMPWSVDSQNFKSKRKSKCSTKNAVMARMNRQRKKEYVANLEGNVESLKENNNELKSKLNEQQVLINSLQNEMKYLRSVLSNSKEIGMLLRKICGGNKELKISSSLLQHTPSSPSEDSGFSSDKIQKDANDFDWPLSPGFDTTEMDEILQCDIPPTGLADFESVIEPYGVCLHVANKQVSLEFCATCSRSASEVLNSGDIYTPSK